MVEISIGIKKDRVALTLNNPGVVKDRLVFQYNRNLDTKLITHLDKILKKNMIDINFIKSYKIEGGPPENNTSTKIARAIIGALKS